MIWDSSNCAVKCNDRQGSLVVFKLANYNKHKNKHPELKDPAFCPKRVIEALKNPKLTIEGNLPHTICYYLDEFTINGITRWTKVVVYEKNRTAKRNPICYIMTAFRIDHVQELQYKHKPTYYR